MAGWLPLRSAHFARCVVDVSIPELCWEWLLHRYDLRSLLSLVQYIVNSLWRICNSFQWTRSTFSWWVTKSSYIFPIGFILNIFIAMPERRYRKTSGRCFRDIKSTQLVKPKFWQRIQIITQGYRATHLHGKVATKTFSRVADVSKNGTWTKCPVLMFTRKT